MASSASQSSAAGKRPRLLDGERRRLSEEAEVAGDDETDEPRGAVAMAVSCQGSRVGVAWFEDGNLFCLESSDDTAGPFRYQLVQLAKLHARPAVIYTSSKAEPELLVALRAPVVVGPAAAPAGTVGTSGAVVAAATAATAAAEGEFEVRTERSTLFHPRAARAVLEAVHVRGTPSGLSSRERLHRLNALVSLSAEQQVCAAGALLAVLAREGQLGVDGAELGAGGDADSAGGNAAMSVASISEVSLDGFLAVDPASLAALQIFQAETHPAAAMGIGGQPKEGFSVFGALNRCVSPGGRRLLRLWFERPIVNLGVLEDRLDGVDFFRLRPDDAKALRDQLRKVKDAPCLLVRLQGQQGLPDPRDFAALQASLAALLMLRDALVHLVPGAEATLMSCGQAGSGCEEATLRCGAALPPLSAAAGNATTPSSNPRRQWQVLGSGAAGQAGSSAAAVVVPGIIFKVATVIREELVLCHNLISGVIEGPHQQGPAADGVAMMIAPGVSEELDELKELYFELPQFLTQLVEAELQRVPRELSHGLDRQLWAIVYMPQVGFVVRMEGGRLAAHLEEQLPDYAFAFEGSSSEDAVCAYYHCNRTRQLTQQYGDVQYRIKDMEAAIACQLTRRLAEFVPHIGRAAAAAAELDCILSLAEAARDLNLCRPQLTRTNELCIEGGRHLLTEALVDAFIPNDTRMQAGAGRIQGCLKWSQALVVRWDGLLAVTQVVTGPNFSGKSCYAKQVALITFLAHVGSFVPASSARIGLTDRIFTRLASREAASVPQSTFMIDLTQVAAMLRLSTERSLCVIDEFGKGTLAADGIGLLCAMLRHFAALPCPPRTVLCTHFSEVLRPQFLQRNPQLCFLTMSVVVDGAELQGPQQPGAQHGGSSRSAAGAGLAGGLQAQQAQQVQHNAQREELVFLYRLVPGHAAPSFGVHCAKLAGVPEKVLDRARGIIAAQASGTPVAAATSEQHTQRVGAYHSLVQRLLQLDVRDKAAAQQLAAAALALGSAAAAGASTAEKPAGGE